MDKSTKKIPIPQVHRLMAGLLPGDHGTELYGNRQTREVYAISDGQRKPFRDIDPSFRATIYEMMVKDPIAMEDLKGMEPEAALEEYAFCQYGAADHEADFAPDGSLSVPENFLCGDNCRCTRWPSKSITLNGHPLTDRQLEVCQKLASDDPDKKIASELNISMSTLDGHKRELFGKAGVHSKAGFVKKAINDKVIQ